MLPLLAVPASGLRAGPHRGKFISNGLYKAFVDGAEAAASDLERIRDGLRLFNERHFFEAHEVLEDVWHRERGEPRLFLQGLIQICAGFHHFQNGNPRGAADLLQRGTEKMRKYPGRYLGIDTNNLLKAVAACRERIERMRDGLESAGSIDFPTIPLTEPT